MSLFIIDLGRPVLFAHIPKTGGTSIRKDRTVERVQSIDGLNILPSIGFIRDPFDRLESAWRDFRYLRKMTELNFIDWVKHMNSDDAKGVIENPATMEHHAAPMTHPVHGLQFVDYIGLFPHVEFYLNDFCANNQLSEVSLPVYRNSRGTPRAIRTLETTRVIETLYYSDYTLWENRVQAET